jgi:saccharopine dehydrogenase (NADP+, L-glutamate forming)
MRRSALGLENGREYNYPDGEAFRHVEMLDVEGLGSFELYPNGNSMPYRELYGIPEAKSIYRGTLRFVGWSETVSAINEIGLTGAPTRSTKGVSYAQYVADLLKVSKDKAREAFSKKTGFDFYTGAFLRLEWIGLFSDDVIPADSASGSDVISFLFHKKLNYEPGERDLVILIDEMVQRDEKSGRRRLVRSSLIDFGIANGDSSIARTTGLPPAITAHMILSGVIKTPGIHIPVTEEIYRPVLAELRNVGIKLEEKILPL